MPPVDPAVFACISMVSLAVGPLIANDIRDIMDSMFAVGLRYNNNNNN